MLVFNLTLKINKSNTYIVLCFFVCFILFVEMLIVFIFFFFFFKQKTAYEMAQCDWSSDVCSSDLAAHENHLLFINSVRMLAAAIDAKDPYTRGHSERVARYSIGIGKNLGLSEQDMRNLRISALLHDVGKIGIDDRILRKPGALSDDEFEVMKGHPVKGAAIMSGVAQLIDIIPGMKYHHEKWSGGGYPDGLVGDYVCFRAL